MKSVLCELTQIVAECRGKTPCSIGGVLLLSFKPEVCDLRLRHVERAISTSSPSPRIL